MEKREKRGPYMTQNAIYFLGKWQCRVCRTEYKPESVTFSALPEDWSCPFCGSFKGLFTPIGVGYPKTG